jgi:hypothetical protein
VNREHVSIHYRSSVQRGANVYISCSESYPTTTGLSVKYVSDIMIYRLFADEERE